jgi:thiamine pyrophosphate-dependent acetolactate synthase large subunit-like protein
MQDDDRDSRPKKSASVSRRKFVRQAAVGAGVAAAFGKGAALLAQDQERPRIRIPDDVRLRETALIPASDFPMTGADVFARVCRDEGLAALFCCPGNYQVVNAIADHGIPSYGGRHEGAMASAADAFIRVTGEIAACSGTEGPGFTNMISAVAAANAARSPLLVLASNMSVRGDDTESRIQRGYQQPTTEGLRKYGKRLITAARVHEYGTYAFRQLRAGIPRPVHLDFTTEVSGARFESPAELEYYHDKTKYRTASRPHPDPKDIRQAAEMIGRARRPIIVASTGVFYSRAWEALRALAEKCQIAVVESAPMRGQFPDDHPLSASTAPDALPSADLVILVGQYCMPSVGEFAFGPDARYIRIDPDPEDIGRNLPIDLGIVSEETAALEALHAEMPAMRHDAWVAEIAAARGRFQEELAELYRQGASYRDAVHPAVIAKELSDFLYRGNLPKEQTTVVQGGFGIARYTRRWLRAYRPAQIMNGAYQYGAIGPDVGYTFGVGVAVQRGVGPQAPYRGHPIVAITGDAGFGYTGFEIESLATYRIPAIVIVYNNNSWGTWPGNRRSKLVSHIHLFQENLRYDKVAEALGAHGEYVTRPEEFRPALDRCYELASTEHIPSVINCQAKKEFGIARQHPPGFLGKVEPGCMAYYH